jgi:hypothetical protein
MPLVIMQKISEEMGQNLEPKSQEQNKWDKTAQNQKTKYSFQKSLIFDDLTSKRMYSLTSLSSLPTNETLNYLHSFVTYHFIFTHLCEHLLQV